MVKSIPDHATTAVWEWFKRTFRRDPARMTRKDAIKVMHKRSQVLKQAGKVRTKEYKTIRRYVTTKGKPKGIWSRKLGMHSRMKKIARVSQRGKTGRKYTRTYIPWSKAEEETMIMNENLKPKKLQMILVRRYGSYRTLSSISAKKSRL